MNELYFLAILVLNLITAYVFFTLGRSGQLPKVKFKPKEHEQIQHQSNFVDTDLEDIRDVNPESIMKSFMASLKKKSPVATPEQTAENFKEMLN